MNATHQPHVHHPEDCRRYLGSLGEYIDGTLSAELCQELEAHLAVCENCRVVVNTLTKTIALYHQMPAPEMPAAVRERLFAVLDLKPYFAADTGSGDEVSQE